MVSVVFTSNRSPLRIRKAFFQSLNLIPVVFLISLEQ